MQEKLLVQIANEIQQTTLNNISQEIHDNVGQILSLTKMQLNLLEHDADKNNELIRDARENISKAMTDLRDLAKGLSSDRIKLLGLYDSVVQEAERINKIDKIKVDVSSNGEKSEPDHHKQLVLFRVIQECFQNIIKHANASHVNVRFIYSTKLFEIFIIDDGVGFEFNSGNKSTGGMGLMNIFNRVKLVGGETRLQSAPGSGTQVIISVPM
jgi:signal transduction histidine kinase